MQLKLEKKELLLNVLEVKCGQFNNNYNNNKDFKDYFLSICFLNLIKTLYIFEEIR